VIHRDHATAHALRVHTIFEKRIYTYFFLSAYIEENMPICSGSNSPPFRDRFVRSPIYKRYCSFTLNSANLQALVETAIRDLFKHWQSSLVNPPPTKWWVYYEDRQKGWKTARKCFEPVRNRIHAEYSHKWFIPYRSVYEMFSELQLRNPLTLNPLTADEKKAIWHFINS
jgi:hypothetical protein